MTADGTTQFAFDEARSADLVVAAMTGAKDERLRQVMESVIRHLHAVVKEVEPTEEEWMTAIKFLTETGHMCTEWRQEFILFSDTFGVSMLVDAVNNRKPSGATETTVLGPFHVASSPLKKMGDTINLEDKGEPLIVSGTVVDENGKAIEGAMLDVWQANSEGFYDVQQKDIQPDMNLRGRFVTGADGRYWFRSSKPLFYPIPHDGPVGALLRNLGRHPYRPAHIHFIVSAPGYQPIVTHLFDKNDPYLASDVVFGVKDSLVCEINQHDDPGRAAEIGLQNPFWSLQHEFKLVREK
ncbi:MAG: intradiol ring-cleavage dioxygenase [Hyphomicrobium sp.]|nr:intradiol ring-cleavage dioxygenase [Hyphomicrobium sp.]MBN9266545.1 intradiol ring-cleavage dioxygenase [Hyphomicrobium sp.]